MRWRQRTLADSAAEIARRERGGGRGWLAAFSIATSLVLVAGAIVWLVVRR